MRLQFILSEILVGLRRNLAMTISVVLVTFVSLTFVGAGALLQMQIGTMKDYWYDRVQVSIFLCVENSDENWAKLARTLGGKLASAGRFGDAAKRTPT